MKKIKKQKPINYGVTPANLRLAWGCWLTRYPALAQAQIKRLKLMYGNNGDI